MGLSGSQEGGDGIMRKEEAGRHRIGGGGILAVLLGLLALGMLLAEPAAAARRTALLHVGLRIVGHHGNALPSSTSSTAPEKTAAAPALEGSVQVVVREGDTLTSLATEYYGTPSAYVHILDANRATIRDPDRILPGTLLILPQVVHGPAH